MEKINEKNKNVNILFVIPLIVLMIGIKCNMIYYVQSDDYWMNNISWGGFSGNPSEHIVFVKCIIGHFLKALYNIYSYPNWYGLYYLCIGLLCVYVVMLVLKKYVSFQVSVFVACFLEVLILLWLTFTVLAYMCTLIAVMVLFSIEESNTKKNKFSKYLVACFLMINAYILRDDAFFTGILLIVPLIIFEIKSKIKALLLFAIICILGISGISICEKLTYGSEIWKNYKDYNSLRSANVDFPIDEYEDNKNLYDRIGMSKNDVNCLKNWIFADKDVFSEENLREIAKNTKVCTRYNYNPISIILKMKEYPIAIIYAFLFLVLSLCFVKTSNNARKLQILQLLFMFGAIGALFVINRPVDRVIVPMGIVGTLSVYYMHIKENTNSLEYGKLIVPIICAVSSIMLVTGICMYATYIKKSNWDSNYEEEREYIWNHTDTLFVVERMHPYTQHQPVTKVNRTKPFLNMMDIGHWRIYNDDYYQIVEKYNLKYKENILLDLVENDNVLFLYEHQNDANAQKMVKTFLEEHTGRKIKVNIIKKFAKTDDILYKFEYDD